MATEPDMRLGGLSIWVDGRQFPNATDYYDGNWLMVRARMEAPSATVKCEGAILSSADIDRFRAELGSLCATLAGKATLDSYEPELKATLKAQSLGHVEGVIEITPDHLNQLHRFTLDLDQSYLPAIIDACASILRRFPVLGTD
jgi:hypothetical protein